MDTYEPIASVDEIIEKTYATEIKDSGNPIEPPIGFEPLYRRYKKYLYECASVAAKCCGGIDIGKSTAARKIFYRGILSFKAYASREMAARIYLGDFFEEKFY